MTTWQFLLLAGLLIAIVVLLALVLLRANNNDKNSDDFEELQDELAGRIHRENQRRVQYTAACRNLRQSQRRQTGAA